MMKNSEIQWIEVGYEIFASEGPKGLKVEVLAKKVKKNKSSFYHHFSDLEVFTSCLLNHHLSQAEKMIGEEKKCKILIPDLLNVFLDFKQDLLFNRQLRINRSIPAFRECFEKTNEEGAQAILPLWTKALGLTENSRLSYMILALSIENFYLQITHETLTYQWLEDYFKNLQSMGKEMKK